MVIGLQRVVGEDYIRFNCSTLKGMSERKIECHFQIHNIEFIISDDSKSCLLTIKQKEYAALCES